MSCDPSARVSSLARSETLPGILPCRNGIRLSQLAKISALYSLEGRGGWREMIRAARKDVLLRQLPSMAL